MSPRRLASAVVAVLVLLLTAPSGGEPDTRERNRRAATEARKLAESDRAAKLRKAREEIQKNPRQKKFILFRYGLKEEDL